MVLGLMKGVEIHGYYDFKEASYIKTQEVNCFFKGVYNWLKVLLVKSLLVKKEEMKPYFL
jgi:hypothetical protein